MHFLNFRIGGKKIIGGLALKGLGAVTGDQGLYNLGKTITGLGVAKTIGAHLFNGKWLMLNYGNLMKNKSN